MFSIFPTLSISLVVASSASALIIPHHREINLEARVPAPLGYATGYLEPFVNYHTRYAALGCGHKHNTPFFTSCCHPLLANEQLSSRPAECTPPSASAGVSPCDTSPIPSATPAVKASPSPKNHKNVGSSPKSTSSSSTSTPRPSPKPKANANLKAPASSSSKTHSSSKALSTPPSSGSSGGTNTGGVATYFTQNGNAGACGSVHKDSDFICAIDQVRYGSSNQKSPLCGKQVRITNTLNGKSVVCTIADDCPTCMNHNSIDLSVGAFTQIATEAQGEVSIEWVFI